MVSLKRVLIGASFMALIAGCATPIGPNYPRYPQRAPAPVPPSMPAPERPSPGSEVPPAPDPAQQPAPSPTLALVRDSELARARGDYEQAIELLERAIRIEPDRADLWLSLATVHLDQGDYRGAEQFARKALLFTGDRYDLEQRAWSVIGAAEAARRQDQRL